MVRKIELSVLGGDDDNKVSLDFDEQKPARELRQLLSEATGVDASKIKLVGQKGRGAFATLEDREKVPKTVKVGNVPNLGKVVAYASSAAKAPSAAGPAQPAPAAAEKAGDITFTRSQALSLQADFLQRYKQPEFQAKLDRVKKISEQRERVQEYRALLLEEQKQVLPKYGLEGSARGAMRMMGAFLPWNDDPEVIDHTNMINRLIDIGMPQTQQIPAPAATAPAPAAQDTDTSATKQTKKVVLHAAGEEDKSRIMFVDDQCTVGELRAMLAETFKEPLTGIKLVRSSSGALTALEEHLKVPGSVTIRASNPKFTFGLQPGGVIITKQQALALSLECKALYQTTDFQQKLEELDRSTEGKPAHERMKLFRNLLLTVQSQVMPKYGFSPTLEGSDDLTRAFSVFGFDHQDINELNREIAELVSLKRGASKPVRGAMATEHKPTVEAAAAGKGGAQRKIHIALQSNKDVTRTLFLDASSPQTGHDLKEILADITGESTHDIKLIGKTGTSAYVTLLDKAKVPSHIMVKGAERIGHPGPPMDTLLTRPQAMALIGELEARYSTEAFQAKLKELDKYAGYERTTHLRDTVFVEQSKVLPKYNFEASQEGVMAMRLAFQVFPSSDEVTRRVAEVSQLLGTMKYHKEKDDHPETPQEPVAVEEPATQPPPTQPPAAEQVDTKAAEEEAAKKAEEDAATRKSREEAGASAGETARLEDVGAILSKIQAEGCLEVEGRPSYEGDRVQLLFELHGKEYTRSITVPAFCSVGKLKSLIAEASDLKRTELKLLSRTAAVLKDEMPAPSIVRIGGPDSLQAVGNHGPIFLTRDQAIEMQKELVKAFTAPEFVRAFYKLDQELEGKSPLERSSRNRDFINPVQLKIICKYGFGNSRESIMHMMNAFGSMQSHDHEVMYYGININKLLELKSRAAHHGPGHKRVKEPEEVIAHQAPPKMSRQTSRESARSADEPSGPRWLIVGGAEKGILVRSSRATTSAELGRLSNGAVVAQQELSGDRLHYQKVKGDGPEHGWVSISLKGSELCRRL